MTDQLRARLAALLERLGIIASAREPLEALLDALEHDPTAPTAVRVPARALDVHIADSLSGLEVSELRSARMIADLGSGAGLPGLVLAAALPAARVALVESNRRKCEFLGRAAARMGLDAAGEARVEIVALRAEEWAAGIGRCEAVTVRAVAALPVLCEYAAPLLAPDGTLVCWKGRVDDREAANGTAAAARLGLSPPVMRKVEPFPGAREHSLWTSQKVAPTPPGFPRRPGIAAKRPLFAPDL